MTAQNGNENNNNPMSIRTWLDIFKREGIIAMIAVFLIYFITNQLNAGVAGNTKAIEDMKHLIEIHTSDSRVDTQAIKYILKIQCIHASHNDNERAECNVVVVDK